MSILGNIWDGEQSKLREMMTRRHYQTANTYMELRCASHYSEHLSHVNALSLYSNPKGCYDHPGLQVREQLDNLPEVSQFISRGPGIQPTETGSIQTSCWHLGSLAASSHWWETGQQLDTSCSFRRKSPGFHGMQSGVTRWEKLVLLFPRHWGIWVKWGCRTLLLCAIRHSAFHGVYTKGGPASCIAVTQTPLQSKMCTFMTWKNVSDTQIEWKM